ncbi:Uncharacterised protein [Vibrio cholerae]|nr:Uncharacterised protein [Vibrio cholerae]
MRGNRYPRHQASPLRCDSLRYRLAQSTTALNGFAPRRALWGNTVSAVYRQTVGVQSALQPAAWATLSIRYFSNSGSGALLFHYSTTQPNPRRGLNWW